MCERQRAREYRKTEAYQRAQARYRSSEKGIATTKAYEQTPEVKERRRLASRSPQGGANKKKYEATEKGKVTRKKALKKYRSSEKGKAKARIRDRARWANPERQAKMKEYHRRYHQTEKGRATRARRNAKRRGWLTDGSQPLTAKEWLEIKAMHQYQCYYCKKKTVILTMDHVIPLSRGGQHIKENIVPACRSCNSKKSDKLTLLC